MLPPFSILFGTLLETGTLPCFRISRVALRIAKLEADADSNATSRRRATEITHSAGALAVVSKLDEACLFECEAISSVT